IRPELIYRVYVFLLEDNNSKLGRTKRLCIRIGEVKHDTRLPISKIYFTPLMSFENARLVERSCKEVLSSKRVKGEIFSADFDDVRATVEYFVQLVSVKPIDTDLNIATVNLKSAEKSE
ncbi:MAG: GIY-YIG nuclease family protein, partial [Selenomonadaceae bacterium]|nr:GIY-YIG nuclease family protein [Selenomonadaceae bacterium]